MAGSRVRDPYLAGEGRLRVEWAEANMPVLMKLRSMYRDSRPLNGLIVSAALHVTKETGALVRTLRDWGARVFLVPSNPLSTQDDVAAALSQEEGVTVVAWRGMDEREYFGAIAEAAKAGPSVVVDDGADLHVYIHENLPDVGKGVIGGNEETTTGVLRLRALEAAGRLMYPVIAVNNALTKHLFDNRYGTGQSTVDGVLRATNVLLAGKRVVVAGYG
ncbi:MAG: adenosylhomocysteinase, partial [Acidilobus sp.]